jgi:CRISPR/Cas system-associated protein Cas7 (RAMP superfamily)
MAIHGLREALKKPHVKAYYLATQWRACNAVKALEQLDNEQQGSAAARTSPGFAIVVVTDGSHTAHMREIEAKPLIVQEAVSHHGDDKGD